MATWIPTQDHEYYEKSWIFAEKDSNGESYHGKNEGGYQAPPLDGVWATAPYFHNGSVPTIDHVLNSRTRPAIYTRSYRTDEAAYDKEKLGWKITTLNEVPKGISKYERRKICDTNETGRGNGGHTFGDKFSDDERRSGD